MTESTSQQSTSGTSSRRSGRDDSTGKVLPATPEPASGEPLKESPSESTIRLTIPGRPFHILGRITASMVVVGVGIGLLCLLTWLWIESAILPEQEGTEALIVEGYTPLVFLIVTALATPVVSSIVGLFEGRTLSTRTEAIVVGVGCLIGATLLVLVSGLFIGVSGAGSGGGPGPADLVALAGLSGLVSAIVGAVTSAVGGT
ncbi:hypothetical protein [Natronorubrum tibetense]|uniref:hypothetical protein n=1 Tax=Natronorubrum tibetense TaxID=63128 RepID=UPI001F4CBC9B|nr:hypothetical protein [Natronorubrum tibetense]